MTATTSKNVRRLALGVVVALGCPACASKEKVAAGPAGEIAIPSMTSTFDPSRQVAGSPSGTPWNVSGSGMPAASANGSSFAR